LQRETVYVTKLNPHISLMQVIFQIANDESPWVISRKLSTESVKYAWVILEAPVGKWTVVFEFIIFYFSKCMFFWEKCVNEEIHPDFLVDSYSSLKTHFKYNSERKNMSVILIYNE
jgi:hypothetical protein